MTGCSNDASQEWHENNDTEVTETNELTEGTPLVILTEKDSSSEAGRKDHGNGSKASMITYDYNNYNNNSSSEAGRKDSGSDKSDASKPESIARDDDGVKDLVREMAKLNSS